MKTCPSITVSWFVFLLLALLAAIPGRAAAPAVVVNEVHYHPVELPAFDANGNPVLDLSDDVHEFVEIYNPSPTNVSLAGWSVGGDVAYDFPTNAVIVSGGYLVIARDPVRLSAIPQYALNASNVFGPYQGRLGNRAGTVRLRDAFDNTVDSVSYSSEFPWAIGADAFGADDEWTGLVSSNFQYRGRSLERVSVSWPANDPANWLASPAPGNPTPARANTVTLAVPKPVVAAFAVSQSADGARLIRANQPVRIDCTFSATNALSAVSVEYFLDDINVTNEARNTVSMTLTGAPSAGSYTAVLPGRPNRTLVRYRIRGNRGTGLETISPRADDPFAWHAYFVTPAIASTNRIYDCFISTASLNTLQTNLFVLQPASVDEAHFRRVTSPDPPGVPRTSWNATEPAVFVFDGEVYDARARYHGSQYRRAAVNNSWKWQFPRYKRMEERSGFFISDNTDESVVVHALNRLAGLPSSYTRWIDFYLNNNAVIRRMDQDEMDDDLTDKFFAEQAVANPGMPREGSGEFYKSQGNFLFHDPWGPFGYGGYRLLPPRPPWTALQRYEQTYGLQMNAWKGHNPFVAMLEGMWAARGDSPTAVNPNTNALRAFLAENFDVDATLTYMAVRTWTGGWDDFNHNHFAWRRENGKWAGLAWDFDGELGGLVQTNASIYLSEFGAPLIYTPFGDPPFWVDANWIKDSFYKAYREQYRRKLFILNHTLLNPTNITALGFGAYRAWADGRFASINSQLALGAFTRPARPTNVAPESFRAALPPAMLETSAYSHSANPRPAHASTTWFIRSAGGSYAAPVFKITSITNLTALPIPFNVLMFGETYFWKAIHTDTNGTPSLDSLETSFVYGADLTQVPLIALDADTQWRYNPGGTNQPAAWRSIGFDDSSWPEGAALLADDATGPLPEPIRTSLTRSNKITFYFRKLFNFQGNPTNALLRVRHVVDDGVAIHLNGVEILRTGINPASSLTAVTPANRTVSHAVYEGPFNILVTNLLAGTNVLAAEVHRINSLSPAVAFGLTLDYLAPPAPGNIVLNEILADNRGGATNGTSSPDFIELHNRTALTQSLNGLSLSDNIQQPGKYVFPPGVSIPPNGFLTVWCDDATNAPGLHTGFALDNDGQTVALFAGTPGGYVLGDSIQFGLQIADRSITRVPDGTGPWMLGLPTPNAASQAESTVSPAGLRINEWMASNPGGPDWFEVYNPSNQPVRLSGLLLSDNLSQPSNTVIAPLSFIAANGYRQFLADEDLEMGARHVDFRLGAGGDTIGLFQTNGAVIDSVSFGSQASAVSQGRLPDGTATIRSFPGTGSPEEPNYVPLAGVLINEVLSHSVSPVEDAIELFSPGAAVDVSGWWLSDDKFAPRKFQLPPGSIVPAGDFLTLYESQFNAVPGAPGNFALSSAHGDSVFLSAAVSGTGALTGERTEAEFGPAENGVTHGRFATSLGTEFVALVSPTLDAPNSYAKVGPVIISEIAFHPPDLPGGDDNDRDEFIELRNITGAAVSLFDPLAPTNRWRLRDAVNFTFPSNITLAAGETILVVGFDPVTNTAARAEFLDTYGSLTARLFGPWSGKLDNSREPVELVKPDAPVAAGPDYGFVPSILVDRVHYADGFPWPDTADGTGFSLMRRLASGYGNDPTNWFAWAPTPGAPNFYNALPLVTLTSPTEGARVLGPGVVQLAASASDPEGMITRVDYFDGTNKIGSATTPPYAITWTVSVFGPHSLTARARDNGNATAVSVPVSLFVFSRPPTVSLTAPAQDALFQSGQNVALAATAADIDTPVAQVDYLVDGAKVAEAYFAPYSANWIAAPGSHLVTAVAIDTTGVTTTSAPVNIFVQSVLHSETVLISAGSLWRYYDQGVDQGVAWTNLNFSDNSWGSGFAELGYGDDLEGRPETTVISYGPNANNKHITSYFRQKFVLTNLASLAQGLIGILRDDGARAFLNGAEIFRNNLPAGAISFGTQAPIGIAGVDETVFHATNVPASAFVLGTNILAVEMHQQVPNSSDLSFDAELRVTNVFYGPAITAAPQARIATSGETVMFSVTAIGSATLAYQWFRDGSPLAGQTAATLTLSNVQTADAGGYSVRVSNSIATATSRPALLAVDNSDGDGDGMPDGWESLYGLDPFSAADRFLDPDGDLANNLAEYRAGTDPTNASSVLRISSLDVGSNAVLTFPVVAGKTYTVEYTDELGVNPWQPLVTIPPAPSAGTVTVSNLVTTTRRVYRLAIPIGP